MFSETLLTAVKSPNFLVMFSMRTYAVACGSRHGSGFRFLLSARLSAVCMADPRRKPPSSKEGPPLPKRRPSRSFAGAETGPGTRQCARELRGLGQIGYQLRHHLGGREDTRVVLDVGIHQWPGSGVAVGVAEEVA